MTTGLLLNKYTYRLHYSPVQKPDYWAYYSIDIHTYALYVHIFHYSYV